MTLLTSVRRGLLTVATALLVVLAVVAVAPLTAPVVQAADGDTVAVTQGDNCVEITPIGDGSTTVEEFYDYRSGSGTQFSSHGTTEYQESQVSQLFAYDGSEGLSLVIIHDELNDGQGGSVVSFDVSGLPAEGSWAVEDDDYPNQDDRYDHNGDTSSIDWYWAPDRTDGAAFRGLEAAGSDGITINGGFNEDADHWEDGSWGHYDRMESWVARSEGGATHELTMDRDQPVTVAAGHCPGSEPSDSAPNASLNAPESAETGETITLDASGSTDEGTIEEYRWDVNGDGEVDETTTSSTFDHAYDSTGTYEPTVTVVDDGGQEDTASTTIEVQNDEPPTPVLEGPSSGDTGEELTFTGRNSTDNGEINSYEWEFGDGGTAAGETVSHAYEEAGSYRVTLTVTDDSGNTANTSSTVEITHRDTTDPNASLLVPATVELGSPTTLDAADSTDDEGIQEYRWDVNGDGAVDEVTTSSSTEHTYDSTGAYEPIVTVVDEAGNEDSDTATTEVEDTTPPTVELSAPDRATVGTEIELSAAGSSDNGEIVSYDWTLGHGVTDSGETVTRSFEEEGTVSVSVTVTDGEGNAAEESKQITVESSSDDGNTGGRTDDDQRDRNSNRRSSGGRTNAGSGSNSNDDGGSDSRQSPPPEPTPELKAELTATGNVSLTGTQLPAGERTDVDLPDQTNETVQFEQLGVTPTESLDEVSFTMQRRPMTDVPADQLLGGVVLHAEDGSPEYVGNVTYVFTVPGSTSEAGDVALYERRNGSWERVKTEVVGESNERVRLRATASKLGPVAVGLRQPDVFIEGLTVTPNSAVAGDEVRVRARIVNSGSLNGTESVTFSIDDTELGRQSVTVPAGGNETVAFEHRFDEAGQYMVQVGDATNQLQVAERKSALSVESVTVSSTEIQPDERLVITATITNSGTQEGSYDASLRLFGEVVETKSVTVPAGEQREVTFERKIDAPGHYTAAVANQTAEFSVSGQKSNSDSTPEVPVGQPGFGALTGLVALLLVALVARVSQ